MSLLLFSSQILANNCFITICFAIACTALSLSVNQAILALRVWYMFGRSPTAQYILCLCYIICKLCTVVAMGMIMNHLQTGMPISSVPGCSSVNFPPSTWVMYVPSAVMHVILFAFTVAKSMDKKWRSVPLRTPLVVRLLRDGALIFLIATVSAIFTAVGAAMNRPDVHYPANFSNMSLVINSVAVSRLMLGLRSLASKVAREPQMILNPTELGRVRWHYCDYRTGHEVVVEMDNHGNDSGIHVR
ncbi:hypothetical protein J3A83DRAFT_3018682 [Scleroderma citrinum]